MTHFNHSTDYYKKMAELQEKLKRSEEERSKLEEKFSLIMKSCREEEEKNIVSFKQRYEKFLEDEKKRQERNERILQILERIEAYAATLSAKSERLRLLRKHYEAYLLYLYPLWRKKTKMERVSPQTSYPKLFSDSPENMLSWQRTSSRMDLLGSAHHTYFESPRESSSLMKQPISNDQDSFSARKLYDNDAKLYDNDEPKSDQDSIIENYVNVAASLLNVPKEEIGGNEKCDEKSIQEQDTSRDLGNMSFSDDGILQDKRFDSTSMSSKPLKPLDNSYKMTVKEIREVSEPDEGDGKGNHRSGPLGSDTPAGDDNAADQTRDGNAQSNTLLDNSSVGDAVYTAQGNPVDNHEDDIRTGSHTVDENAAFAVDSSNVEQENGQNVNNRQFENHTDEQHANVIDARIGEENICQEEYENANIREYTDATNEHRREGHADGAGQEQYAEESDKQQYNPENQGDYLFENQGEYTIDDQGEQYGAEYQTLGPEAENYVQYSENEENQFASETQHFQENNEPNQYEQTQYAEGTQEYEPDYYQQGYLPQLLEDDTNETGGEFIHSQPQDGNEMQEYNLEHENIDAGNYSHQFQAHSDLEQNSQRQYEEQYSNGDNVGDQYIPVDDQRNLYDNNKVAENPDYENVLTDEDMENQMYIHPEQTEAMRGSEQNEMSAPAMEPQFGEESVVQNVLDPVHDVPDTSDPRNEEMYDDGSQVGAVADLEATTVVEGIAAEDHDDNITGEMPQTQAYGIETDSSESSVNPPQGFLAPGLYPDKSANQMIKSEADSILTSDQDEVENQLAALVQEDIPSVPEVPVSKESLGDVLQNDTLTPEKLPEPTGEAKPPVRKDTKASDVKNDGSDGANVGAKKIPSLIKVLESDTDSLNLNESVTDSNEFDFSTE